MRKVTRKELEGLFLIRGVGGIGVLWQAAPFFFGNLSLTLHGTRNETISRQALDGRECLGLKRMKAPNHRMQQLRAVGCWTDLGKRNAAADPERSAEKIR